MTTQVVSNQVSAPAVCVLVGLPAVPGSSRDYLVSGTWGLTTRARMPHP